MKNLFHVSTDINNKEAKAAIAVKYINSITISCDTCPKNV